MIPTLKRAMWLTKRIGLLCFEGAVGNWGETTAPGLALGDSEDDPVAPLVADLPRTLGQPLLADAVAAGKLPVGEQPGRCAGQVLVLDAVHVHDEQPAAVLLERGREVVPVLLDDDPDLGAVDAGHEGVHLQARDVLRIRPPGRALAATVELRHLLRGQR